MSKLTIIKEAEHLAGKLCLGSYPGGGSGECLPWHIPEGSGAERYTAKTSKWSLGL